VPCCTKSPKLRRHRYSLHIDPLLELSRGLLILNLRTTVTRYCGNLHNARTKLAAMLSVSISGMRKSFVVVLRSTGRDQPLHDTPVF
jgi:hypothetical protein